MPNVYPKPSSVRETTQAQSMSLRSWYNGPVDGWNMCNDGRVLRISDSMSVRVSGGNVPALRARLARAKQDL